MRLATRISLHHTLWTACRSLHNSLTEQEKRLKDKKNESRRNNSKDSAHP